MGGGSLFIGILLILAHRNVTSAAKRILFGTSIGFYILILIQLKQMIFDKNVVFWPVFITFFILGPYPFTFHILKSISIFSKILYKLYYVKICQHNNSYIY